MREKKKRGGREKREGKRANRRGHLKASCWSGFGMTSLLLLHFFLILFGYTSSERNEIMTPFKKAVLMIAIDYMT